MKIIIYNLEFANINVIMKKQFTFIGNRGCFLHNNFYEYCKYCNPTYINRQIVFFINQFLKIEIDKEEFRILKENLL